MIVAHGGFDSNYEEFFPQMMYLRQLGYTVYLFEGPGQGACLRTARRSPRHHPLRLWLADQSSVSVKKGKGMDFFKTYYERIGSTNAYALARFLWQVDLRPLADKLTKDYLIIGGSKDTMSSRASIGRQMYLLKNAKSITARKITEKELGADHCSCDNQQVVMDMIDLWIESLKRRDESLQRAH